MLGLFSFTTFTFCWNTTSWSADAYSFGVKINISRKTSFCVKTNFYFPLTRCFVRQGEFRLFQQEVSCFFSSLVFSENRHFNWLYFRGKCRWWRSADGAIAIDEIGREGLRLQPRCPTKQVSYAYACCLMRWWNCKQWGVKFELCCMLENFIQWIRILWTFAYICHVNCLMCQELSFLGIY